MRAPAQGSQLTCETYGEETVTGFFCTFFPLFTSTYLLITYSLPQHQLKQRPFLTAVQSQDTQRKLKAPLKVFVHDTLSRYFYILKKSLRNKFFNEFQFNKVDDEFILTVKSISRMKINTNAYSASDTVLQSLQTL